MNGLSYVCSASIGGDQLVWTAGHCVYDPGIKQWATQWTFYPAYNDGNGQYGPFIATRLHATMPWFANMDFAYDYALAEIGTIFPAGLTRFQVGADLQPESTT